VPPSEDTAEGHFRRGFTLVQLNKGDSAGATKELLEEAVRDLQRAIELGYGDAANAHFLSATAYRSIAFVQVSAESGERDKYLGLAIGEYVKAIDARPDFVEARVDVAELLRGDERIAQLREVVRLAPDNATALFALGSDLFEKGQVAEGARLFERAVQRFSPEDLTNFGPAVVGLLRSKHMEEEARRVEKTIRERKNPLTGAPD
jgi:tetratricopeptide (TPR) repeat protein